jgi:hypothetical protein
MLKIPHSLDSRPTDGGEIIRLTDRPRFTQQKHFLFLSLVLISVRGQVNKRGLVRSEELGKLIKVNTLSGFETEIFFLLALRLNHYTTAYPQIIIEIDNVYILPRINLGMIDQHRSLHRPQEGMLSDSPQSNTSFAYSPDILSCNKTNNKRRGFYSTSELIRLSERHGRRSRTDFCGRQRWLVSATNPYGR